MPDQSGSNAQSHCGGANYSYDALVSYGIEPPGPAWLLALLAWMERRAHGRAPLFRRKFIRIFLAAFSMG